MIRKSLYLAASAAVLLSAAHAQAATITGTAGIFSTVTSSTATGAFKLAQELTYFTAFSSATGAAATQASASFNLTPTTSFTVGESLLLTVDLAQGGVFTSSTGFAVTGTGACTVQSTAAVTPVARNATSAQYLVNLTGTCTTAGLVITAPVQVTGSDLIIGAQLQQSFGGSLINVDGGRVAATFVDVTRAFSATVTASGNNATAQVSSGYRTLNASTNLGEVSVSASSSVSKALAPASTVTSADIAGVALTATAVTGSFTGINVSTNGNRFDSATSSATISTVRVFDLGSSATGDFDITVVDNTSTATTAGINADAVIPASTFTVSAAVDLVDGLTDFAASAPISSVVRDGTSFKAPWIALGAPAANSTIRLANNGSTDTGPIQMTLTSSTGGAPNASQTVTISAAQLVAGSLTASGGIPAGGVVSISGAALRTAFSTTAANGDVEVTIEAQPQFISGKVRVTQASGQVFETSLGNLSGGVS